MCKPTHKFCVNVTLSKNFSAECYVNLISRSLNCKPSKSKKKIKSEKAFCDMIDNFEYLDMSPISLSYRDKHGDESVPSLYELLELTY